jgi:glycosyltransferase involved in cell wall biosynthesis
MSFDQLVTIGLPVRDAGVRVVDVVGSVLAQDHENIELVISDNASTDDTEEVCRELARSDHRIVYHRHAENIGLLGNFRHVMRVGTGTFFRWIGDDDRLEPNFVSRCLNVFAEDSRLILVTTGLTYAGPDGPTQSIAYHGTGLSADDPVDRLIEMLRLLNESHLLIDPLYSLMRRASVVNIPRRNMLREDQVFAAKLAVAGAWGHTSEILAHRGWKPNKIKGMARRLDVPTWQSHFSNTLQCREIVRWLRESGLTIEQQRRARLAVYRMYLRRERLMYEHRGRKLLRIVTGR